MKINQTAGIPQDYHMTILSVDEAARQLAAAGLTNAAAIGTGVFSDMLMMGESAESIRALRSMLAARDAVIVDSKHAAAVSKLVVQARAKQEKAAQKNQPQPEAAPQAEPIIPHAAPTIDFDAQEQPAQPELPLNADEQPEAPLEAAEPESAPAEPAVEMQLPVGQEAQPAEDAPAFPRPAFVLMLDDLSAVPSLASFKGALPDLIVVQPALLESSAEQVREALMRVIAVSMDTICAKVLSEGVHSAVADTHVRATNAYLDGSCTPVEAARLMLTRGLDGGAICRLGHAVAKHCGMTPGEAMHAVTPAVAPHLRESATTGDIAPIPALKLCDIPAIVKESVKTAYPMKHPLTKDDLTSVLRSLYAFRSEPIQIEALVDMQEAFFRTGRTLPVAFRQHQLTMLLNWIDTHEAEIESALMQDLGKCAFEAFETEIMLVRKEIKTLRRRLPCWQANRFGIAPLVHFPATTRRVRNPHGRVLIMSPWNYPFLLTMDPLVGALAGGNCVVLKPSAYAPATSRLFADMAHDLFDPEYVAVVEGGRAENQSLLKQKFDHIFFTGSVSVGKLVMQSAAEHLTPVTLELGGKSPCIVDETADIALAARRVAWGKFVNAGQTCVAPDYVLCHPSVADEFIMEVERSIRALYGSDPVDNGELCRIVNERHFDRLAKLIEDSDTAIGGYHDRSVLKIEPTIVKNVRWDDAVMQEEIFGPILPVMTWDGDFSDVLDQIESRPRPLAAYLFTTSKERKRQFLRQLRFGGGCINDVLCHLATALPFGGVGESGMGAYHGRYSFNTFTHEKGVLIKSNRIDVPVRYAPYGSKLRLLRTLSKYLP